MKVKTKKIRKRRVFGVVTKPRLCVFRSLKHIYAQLIDDQKGKTLVSANDLELEKENKKRKANKKTKTEKAYEVGLLIAQKAKKNKISKVVFDRRNYRYHGRVKALAQGARDGGLKF